MENSLIYKWNEENTQTQHCFFGVHLLFTVCVPLRFNYDMFRFVALCHCKLSTLHKPFRLVAVKFRLSQQVIYICLIDKRIDFRTFLKRGLDRSSNSGKFAKVNKSITPVLGINTAYCGEKLFQT